jgi:ABC-type sugar transport system ATPase subunit
LGRAIVRNPKVFLFDEPLSNLDAKMRVQMRSETAGEDPEAGRGPLLCGECGGQSADSALARQCGEPGHMKVELAEPMGSESLVYLKTGSGSVIARIHGDHIFHLGEDVPAYFDMEKATFFDPKT